MMLHTDSMLSYPNSRTLHSERDNNDIIRQSRCVSWTQTTSPASNRNWSSELLLAPSLRYFESCLSICSQPLSSSTSCTARWAASYSLRTVRRRLPPTSAQLRSQARQADSDSPLSGSACAGPGRGDSNCGAGGGRQWLVWSWRQTHSSPFCS